MPSESPSLIHIPAADLDVANMQQVLAHLQPLLARLFSRPSRKKKAPFFRVTHTEIEGVAVGDPVSVQRPEYLSHGAVEGIDGSCAIFSEHVITGVYTDA